MSLLANHAQLQSTPPIGFVAPLQKVKRALGLDPELGAATSVVVGVHGMGGVGKTTLAQAVYDTSSTYYTGSQSRIYLRVGEQCKTSRDLSERRCEMLKALANDSAKPTFPSPEAERARLQAVLRSGPPNLLVLDDLWEEKQLHWLLACEDSEDPQAAVAKFYPGSRVLLTSRRQSIVTVPGHEEGVVHLTGLDDVSSKQLLLREAANPLAASAELTPDQIEEALDLCGGLPLALVVLGRLLRKATGRSQVRLQSASSYVQSLRFAKPHGVYQYGGRCVFLFCW